MRLSSLLEHKVPSWRDYAGALSQRRLPGPRGESRPVRHPRDSSETTVELALTALLNDYSIHVGDQLRALPSPRAVAGIEAAYLIGTGVWPLLHRASFERVTGEKREFWLVRTVGGLAAAAGLAMGVAVARGSKRPEIIVLALATGLVFAVADVRAVRTESRIYLADALLQAAFTPAWLGSWKRAGEQR